MNDDDRSLCPVEKAVINLINSKQGVFYSALIMQMKRVPMKMERGAMGVGFKDGMVNLYYDPDWIKDWTIQQLMFALEHECLHLVLDHLIRIGDRDMVLSNLAADLCVNGYILDDPGPCTPPYQIVVPQQGAFSDMPKGKHFEWYYDKIYDKAEKYSVTVNKDGSITVKNDKTGKSETFKPNDHGEWGSMEEGDSSLNKEVIKVMVKEAYQEAKSRGCTPGGAVSELIEELLGKNQLNWRALLRRFVAASLISNDRKSSWKRVNRRFGDTFPGHVRTRQPKILVHFDTSGSMDESSLLEAVAELRGLQRIYNATIHVLEGDADLQREYDLSKFTHVKTDFHGRGGTSHKFLWEYVKKNACDVVISFTDMGSDITVADRPRCGVIFVTPSNMSGQKVEPPFGRLISIDKK